MFLEEPLFLSVENNQPPSGPPSGWEIFMGHVETAFENAMAFLHGALDYLTRSDVTIIIFLCAILITLIRRLPDKK